MTRLFELDFQLLHDTVLLAISVFFLCVALSYLLFEPARKLLRERTEHIGDELRMAKKEKKQGEKYRASYEKHLQEADKEVERLLSEARSKAENATRMINAAKSVILPSSIKREITLNFLFLFEPSQASLRDASSPEGGSFFLCAHSLPLPRRRCCRPGYRTLAQCA